MIEMPLVMNRSLSKDCDRQWPFECLLKERLDFTSLRKHPTARAGIAYERSRGYERTFAHRTKLGQLFFGFNFQKRLRDLSVRAGNLLLSAADFYFCVR